MSNESNDPAVAIGIGLKQSEWDKIDQIAGELSMTRHALAVYAIRYFLKQLEAGEIKITMRPALPE